MTAQVKTLKKSRYRRRRFRRKGQWLSATQKAQVRHIAKIEAGKNLELQEHLITYGPSSVSYAGISNDLLNGLSMSGDSLTPVQLMVKFNCIYADTTNLMRVMLVQYKGNQSANPLALNEVINASHVSTVYAPLSYPERDYRQLYHILYDRVYSLNSAGNQQMTDYFTVPRKDLPTKCTGSGGSVLVNTFHLVVFSDSGTVTHPTITVNARFLYFDDA